MNENMITTSVKEIIKSLPANILLVAAAKTRTSEEVKTAVKAGVKIIGYNYVQEAEQIYKNLDTAGTVKWHMIGNLQRNKTKRAVRLFDMIETIDSERIAKSVNRHCQDIGKTMHVLVEINSGRESNKTGVMPDEVEELVKTISSLSFLKIQGLMTMGPRFGNPEDARPYFKATKSTFDRLKKAGIPNVEMKYLSMGMSNSYKIAIEEGANVVRIGTKLFGGRCKI